ncbi:MAG: transposase [Flavobacteriales bacterium]|jgi:transposase
MMYVCILDSDANILIHKNISTNEKAFLRLIKPYLGDIVVGIECMFSWYWLADFCATNGIEFILGHALYMRCIHGGKAKNDKIDSEKIARIMCGHNFPLAYVYPQDMRAVRDLMRRRGYLVRMKSEVQAHIKITNYQYNLPTIEKNLVHKSNRAGLAEHFLEPSVRLNVETDISVMDSLHEDINRLNNYIIKHARKFSPRALYKLKTVRGIGDVLALTILYEIHDIDRFPSVQNFCSYSRLVKCSKESAGKNYGSSGSKIGNPHLKWAFSEAAVLFLRDSDRAKAYVDKLTKKHGKGKALSILAHKLGRAIYFMLKRDDAFDENYFLDPSFGWRV